MITKLNLQITAEILQSEISYSGEIIGEGSFGLVYKCVFPTNNKKITKKIWQESDFAEEALVFE